MVTNQGQQAECRGRFVGAVLRDVVTQRLLALQGQSCTSKERRDKPVGARGLKL